MIKLKLTTNKKKVIEGIKNFSLYLSDLSPVMRDIGILFIRDIDLNFHQGGRPSAWQPAKPNGQRLIDYGTLRASFGTDFIGQNNPTWGAGENYKIFDLKKLSIEVGSNLPYARFYVPGPDQNKHGWNVLYIPKETFKNAEYLVQQYVFRALK